MQSWCTHCWGANALQGTVCAFWFSFTIYIHQSTYWLCWACGRKTENPEETQPDIGRTCPEIWALDWTGDQAAIWLIFCNCFILVMVVVDPESILATMGVNTLWMGWQSITGLHAHTQSNSSKYIFSLRWHEEETCRGTSGRDPGSAIINHCSSQTVRYNCKSSSAKGFKRNSSVSIISVLNWRLASQTGDLNCSKIETWVWNVHRNCCLQAIHWGTSTAFFAGVCSSLFLFFHAFSRRQHCTF